MTSSELPPDPDEPMVSEATVAHLLANTGREVDEDDAWKHQVLQAVRAEPAVAPRTRWLSIAVPTAAAAALMLWWSVPAPAPQVRQASEPFVEIVDVVTKSGRRGDAYHPGDRILLRASPNGSTVVDSLRVYRGRRTLVASCPADPECEQWQDTGWQLWLRLRSRGTYQPVVVRGPAAPPTQSLDDDVEAIRQAGGEITLGEAFEVR